MTDVSALEPTEQQVTVAMREFERFAARLLRYPEKDRWHTNDVLGMREALRAAFALSAPSGWQPISTAPRDGTVVLLLSTERFGDRVPALASWWSQEKIADENGGDPDDYEPGWSTVDHTPFCLPTHWLPLPPPPAEQEREG